MILPSYIITSIFFTLVQIFQNMRNEVSRSKNLILTLLLPFMGYPSNRYGLKGKSDKQTIFHNLALVNSMFWFIFFCLPKDFLLEFTGGNFSTKNTSDLYVGGAMDLAEGLFVGAANIFMMLVLFIVALLTIIIPLIMAAFVRK